MSPCNCLDTEIAFCFLVSHCSRILTSNASQRLLVALGQDFFLCGSQSDACLSDCQPNQPGWPASSAERWKRYSRNAGSSVRLAARLNASSSFILPVQQSKQMSARSPIWLIIRDPIRWNLFKRGKSDSRLACLRDRNSSTNERTDTRRNSHQALVEQCDFLPIDASSFRSIGVKRLNRSFQLIASHMIEGSS